MNRQSLRFGLSLAISFQMVVSPVSVALAGPEAARNAQPNTQQRVQNLLFRPNAQGEYDIIVRDALTNAEVKVDLGREKVFSVNEVTIGGFARFQLINPTTDKMRGAQIISWLDLPTEAQVKIALQTKNAKGNRQFDMNGRFSPGAVIITDNGTTYLVNRPVSQTTARLENLRLDLSSPKLKQTIFSKALRTMSRWSPYAAGKALEREVRGLQEKLAPQTYKEMARAQRNARIKNAANKTVSAINVMHTQITIAVLSVIGLTMAKVREAKLQGKPVDMKELAVMSYESALHVANDPDIYFGQIGSKLVERGLKLFGIDQRIARSIEITFMGKPVSITPAQAATMTAAEIAQAQAARAPNAIIAKILRNQTARMYFTKILGNAAHSTITFLGWEAGGQLWDEARDMLETKEEQDAASGMWTMLARAAAGDKYHTSVTCSETFTEEAAQSITVPAGVTPKDDQMFVEPQQAPTDASKQVAAEKAPAAQKENCKVPVRTFNRLVLSRMMHNMGQILINDDERRDYWFYNTWRSRVATGEFATLIACMSTASVIGGSVGTAIFPLAGTVAGFGIGLVSGTIGGVASIMLPQPLKDGITLAIKEGREGWNQVALNLNDKVLKLRLDPQSRMGSLFDKITDWKVERKVDAGMAAPVLGPIIGSLGNPGSVGAGIASGLAAWYTRQSWATPEYAEKLRKKFTPTFASELDERGRKREDLLTIYFEAAHMLKLRITQAEQENAIATQTLERQKNDPVFNTYIEKVKRSVKTAAFIALAPAAGLYYSRPLTEIIRENEVLTKVCKMGLKVFLKKIRDFYIGESTVLRELHDGRHKTPDTIDALDSPQYNVDLLNEYIQNWVNLAAEANFSAPVQQAAVGGMMKSQVGDGPLALAPDVQNASAALEQANRYGFREGPLVMAIDNAKLAGIEIFGKTIEDDVTVDSLAEELSDPSIIQQDPRLKMIQTEENAKIIEEIQAIVRQNGGKEPSREQVEELTNKLQQAGIQLIATPANSNQLAPEDEQ